MRPETMGWNDAAGMADSLAGIDGTDEAMAAPGMVFAPQLPADTGDTENAADDGGKPAVSPADARADEQSRVCAVSVAALPDSRSDEALLEAFDPHNMLAQDTYVPIQFAGMHGCAAAEIPGTSGAPPADRPDVDDLAMSGVGTVPGHVVSALSGDDAHTRARTPERRAISPAAIVLACCAPVLLGVAVAAQFADNMLVHYLGWLVFVDGIGIPAAMLAVVTLVRQHKDSRYHSAAASAMTRAMVVLVVALVAVGFASRDVPPLLARHEVQFVPTQLTSGQHGLFSSRGYEVKGYDPVTGAGVVLRISQGQFAACHAAIPSSSDAGSWHATAHDLPHSGVALDLTCSVQKNEG